MLTRIGVQRDYFWNLSRAILLARETIQIHDWGLSPGMLPFLVLLRLLPPYPLPLLELQMRRPHKDKYRLDNLLEMKAREGVKIYIIL